VLLGVVALSAILFPFLIATARKKIPAQVLYAWAIPLATSTLLLILLIRYFSQRLDLMWKTGLSLGFGLFWSVAGFQLTRMAKKSKDAWSRGQRRITRALGILFMLFGLFLTLATIYQFNG